MQMDGSSAFFFDGPIEKESEPIKKRKGPIKKESEPIKKWRTYQKRE